MERRPGLASGALRRAGPALCGALLLWLPVACEDDLEEVESGWEQTGTTAGDWGASNPGESAPAAGDSQPASADAVLPVAVPIPESTERLKLNVSIDGNAVTRKIETGPLSVAGYYKVQLSPANLPRATASPTFRWVAEGAVRTWPQEFPIELPRDGRSHVIAWIDLDGNGSLSVGDRVSRPIDPLAEDAGESLELRIDRIFVDPSVEATAGPGPSGAGGPSASGPPSGPDGPAAGGGGWGCGGRPDTGLLMGAKGAQGKRKVRVEAGAASAKAGRGRLIVYGFPSEQLNSLGMPFEDGQPILVWVNPKKTGKWPVVVEVPIPDDANLRLLPVLDLDGDGRLGSGDHLGQPTSLQDALQSDGVLKLKIDRNLPSRDDGGPGGPAGAPGQTGDARGGP